MHIIVLLIVGVFIYALFQVIGPVGFVKLIVGLFLGFVAFWVVVLILVKPWEQAGKVPKVPDDYSEFTVVTPAPKVSIEEQVRLAKCSQAEASIQNNIARIANTGDRVTDAALGAYSEGLPSNNINKAKNILKKNKCS